MYNFAKLSLTDRSDAFRYVAEQIRLNDAIIEKDFYVVLLLDILFHQTELGQHFAFKGGTSLSKGYNIIQRFSEDIDVVLDWSVLDVSPELAWHERSHRQQQLFDDRLDQQAAAWIAEVLVPRLQKAFDKLQLRDLELSIAEDDPQTVIVHYPNQFPITGILPEVRLEIGPLAAWTPITKRTIKPYLVDYIPALFNQTTTSIPTVQAERTFWEKTTILHKEANRRNDRTVRRISRHYYDVYMLAHSSIKVAAFAQPDLLTQVVAFKTKFYLDNTAHYENATIQKLELLPKEELIPELEKDYANMQPMFFAPPASFDHILDDLKKLQTEIHQLTPPI